jgi:hypothetical protein
MNEFYNNLQQQGTPHLGEKTETDKINIQLKALNRAINLLMALLRYRKVLTENEVGWVTYIKNDVRLALTIDSEDLLTNFLDLASRVACPKNHEGAIALIRNHQIVGPPKSGVTNRPQIP